MLMSSFNGIAGLCVDLGFVFKRVDKCKGAKLLECKVLEWKSIRERKYLGGNIIRRKNIKQSSVCFKIINNDFFNFNLSKHPTPPSCLSLGDYKIPFLLYVDSTPNMEREGCM